MYIEFIPLRSNPDVTKQLLEQADSDFREYLGLTAPLYEEINHIVNPDDYTSYYAIYVDGMLVGTVYYYDYCKEYDKCSIGYGLLPTFRGFGLTFPILNQFCDMLEKNMNMIRIQADVETTNKHCLQSFGSMLEKLKFKYEYTANNYWGYHVTCNIYSRCIE